MNWAHASEGLQVLPEEFAESGPRGAYYAGRPLAAIVAEGDVAYLEWLASDAITEPALRAAAAALIPLARERAAREDCDAKPPALHVRLELEQVGRVWVSAESREDEMRLRSWLRRSHALQALPEALGRHLDALDALDAEQAA